MSDTPPPKLTQAEYELEQWESERAVHMLGDLLIVVCVVLVIAVVVYALSPGPLGRDILRAQANVAPCITIK